MTGAFLRRWALVHLALVALVASYSDGELPRATYVHGADRGRLWQCPRPTCMRVEQVLLHRPRCYGTPEKKHDPEYADPVSEDEDLRPSDTRHLFR